MTEKRIATGSTGTGTSENPASFAMYSATRKRRKDQRHKRDVGGSEIGELNITPMLDLMTILLVFLLISFASSSQNVNVANLTLPYSTTKIPIDEALTLMVSRDGILVDQRLVTKLDDKGWFMPEDLPEGPQGYLVKPLYDALEVRAEHFKRIEEYGGSQFVGRVAVIADKNVPYAVIFRVLYTCGRAEFGRFKMFVQKP
ncbi:MAG: biopolymer transporter ExbD [Deltaproteobacteria bacterium]|nr:biopolymer transporter ExbD [Deltaproteobacteria bacterium]